ncbi:hypothetical protein EX30DRAFT_344966 [Ascodesmis nigricans]|uniref:CCHC-type domain-containing protein n=1 Tax=Ascodesmis nigricans TaxID=341454 RepID=A0A4S2MPT4_9PEZI|nr:hypothetical protein EX30DRAFT_344966 [Ascodesmis nigricans]
MDSYGSAPQQGYNGGGRACYNCGEPGHQVRNFQSMMKTLKYTDAPCSVTGSGMP